MFKASEIAGSGGSICLFVCIFCLFEENFIILILIFKYFGNLFF